MKGKRERNYRDFDMLENLFPCPEPDKTMDELTVDTKYLICIFKDLLRYQDIVVTGSYQEKK